jgi:DNA-binding response OmpR family regulator
MKGLCLFSKKKYNGNKIKSHFREVELKHEGFGVDKVHDGRSGLEMALEGNYGLIVLDIMLPGLNGMEVCRRIRKESEVPIIMLTAKDDTMDKVMGLDLGADDYITKPFAIEELLARIRRIFRRPLTSTQTAVEHTVVECGPIKIDISQHAVFFDSKTVELTKKEYDLLHYLVQNKGIALSRDQILDEVWGYDYYGDTNVVDVYIRYLRTKLDNAYGTKLIHTIRGVGYLVKED